MKRTGKTQIELVKYTPFDAENVLGAIGSATLKMTHGLTTNFSHVDVYSHQIGEDGLPKLDALSGYQSLDYDIHTELMG